MSGMSHALSLIFECACLALPACLYILRAALLLSPFGFFVISHLCHRTVNYRILWSFCTITFPMLPCFTGVVLGMWCTVMVLCDLFEIFADVEVLLL